MTATTDNDALDRAEAMLTAAGFVFERGQSRSKYWSRPTHIGATIRTSDHRQGASSHGCITAEVLVVDDPGRFLLGWDAEEAKIAEHVAEAIADYDAKAELAE